MFYKYPRWSSILGLVYQLSLFTIPCLVLRFRAYIFQAHHTPFNLCRAMRSIILDRVIALSLLFTNIAIAQPTSNGSDKVGLESEICGAPGFIKNDQYSVANYMSEQYLSPGGCSDACHNHLGCLSFTFNDGANGYKPFCELNLGTSSELGFMVDSDSHYTGNSILTPIKTKC